MTFQWNVSDPVRASALKRAMAASNQSALWSEAVLDWPDLSFYHTFYESDTPKSGSEFLRVSQDHGCSSQHKLPWKRSRNPTWTASTTDVVSASKST